MKNRERIRFITESAILIALGTILSFIPIGPPLPLGGKITPCSMLPVIIIAYRYGTLRGLGAALVYALFQFALSLGEVLSWGLSVPIFLGAALLDYILPYTLLGLAGVFGAKTLGRRLSGAALVLGLRFVSHFLSGVILFAELGQWELFGKLFENSPALYSIAYNGFYMLPELILTGIAVVILSRIPVMKKFLSPVSSLSC